MVVVGVESKFGVLGEERSRGSGDFLLDALNPAGVRIGYSGVRQTAAELVSFPPLFFFLWPRTSHVEGVADIFGVGGKPSESGVDASCGGPPPRETLEGDAAASLWGELIGESIGMLTAGSCWPLSLLFCLRRCGESGELLSSFVYHSWI